MKFSDLSILFVIFTFLIGCSSLNPEKPVKTSPPPIKRSKNPMNVSFYKNGQSPAANYKVIGMAAISKYNPQGIKRQEAIIRDAMRNIAADMGGDAVLDLEATPQFMLGKVIVYQNKPIV